jgi:hypothetical protein
VTTTNFEEVETSGPGGTVGLDMMIDDDGDMGYWRWSGKEEIVRGQFS